MTFIKTHKMAILVTLMAILGIALMTGIGFASAGATTTPMQTWGHAYLDHIPIPHGTIVDVYIGSDTTPSGTTETSVLGQYGSMMVMGDSSRYGEPLRYTIDGYPTTKIGPDSGVFGLENQEVSLHGFTQGVPISATHNWTFYGAGFSPKHLPDYFTGTVNLSLIIDIPQEVQGVYWFDDIDLVWRSWAYNAPPCNPNCALEVLQGGLVADYMIVTTGACTWEIPLQ